MVKIKIYLLVIATLFAGFCAQSQTPATIVFPNPTPNPPILSVDSYTRASSKINLQDGFIFGFINNANTTNLLNLNISSYPPHVNNNYYDPSDPSLSVVKNSGLVLGTTEGNMDVSPVGAFSYQVPIICSPGTAGMQPNVSVVYNSNSGYGSLGKGFNLAGISCISRVNKTVFYDGWNTGIYFSNNNNGGTNSDAFALDGQRLLISSGYYGQTNSTYKTEVESYGTITSLASTTDGPSYFTVVAKDGKVIEYGNTADSKLKAVGAPTKILSWYINKITDEFGNYMTYTYNNSDGELVIDRIDYTMNSAAGLSGYNSIQFEYMARSDKRSCYVGSGNVYLNTKLLKSITSTNLNNSVTQKYTFEYIYNNESLLYSITQVDAQGNELNPTYFEWTKSGIYKSSTNTPHYPPNAITPAVGPLNTNVGILLSVAADLNGDGKKDLLTVKNQNINQAVTFDVFRSVVASGLPFGARNDFVQENAVAIPNNLLQNDLATRPLIDVYVFDEDDDGREEVYISFGSGSTTYWIQKIKLTGGTYNVTTDYTGNDPANVSQINIYKKSSSAPSSIITRTVRSGYLYAKEDVTGDNIKDVIVVDQNGVKVIDPTNAQPYYPMSNYWSTKSVVMAKLADYDGDGVLDIFVISNSAVDCNNTANHFGLSRNFVLNVLSANTPNSWHNGYTQNFNDKVYNKLVPINLDYNMSAVCNVDEISNFFERAVDNIDFADFNGDGRTDLIYNLKANLTEKDVYVSLSKNAFTFAADYKIGTVPIQLNGVDAAFFSQDINNDGLADLAAISHNNTTYQQYFTYYPNIGNALSAPASVFNIMNQFAGTMGDFDGDGSQDFVAQPGFLIGVGLVYNVFDQPGIQKVKRIYNIRNDYKIDYGFMATRKAEDGYYLYNETASSNPVSIKVLRPDLYVVSSTDFNGVINKYGYENGLFHKEGKGFLGFEKNVVYTQNTNLISVSKQLFDGTKDYLSSSETVSGIASSTPNSFLAISTISKKLTTNFGYMATGTNRYLSYIEKTEKDYLAITKTRKTILYDNVKAGNVENITTEFLPWTGNALMRQEVEYFQYTSINNSFNNLTYYKLLSKQHYRDATVNGSPTSTMLQTNFAFDNLGRLTSKVENSNVPSLAVTTSYSNFNAFGSPKTISVSAPDLSQSRTTLLLYDNTGRFITKQTNAIGNWEEFIYEPVYGNKIQEKDISGLITTYKYDGFGRIINTSYPNGAINYVKYEWYPYSVPNGGNYYGSKVTTMIEGSGNSVKYADRNGNITRTEHDGFNGTIAFTERKYNDVNQILEVKLPRYQSQTYYKTITYTYDNYLRPLKVRETINNINTDIDYAYNGLANDNTSTQGYVNVTAPTSNPAETQSVRKINNSASQVVLVTNYSGANPAHTVTYAYNQFNEPVKATTSFPTMAGAITTFGYDALGRRQTLVDPSAGTSTYQYNSIGELLQQTTPEGTYNFTYDQLGRMLTKTGLNSYSYQYVTAANGRQQLLSVTGPNALTEFKYDNLGRTTEKKETITTSGNKILKSNFTYNKYGQLVDHTYPGGFVTTNEYDGLGYLRKIKNANTVIWQVNSMAAPGLINQFSYNNGQISNNFTYDNNLNLSQVDYGNFLQQSYAVSVKNGDLLSRASLYQPTNVSNNEQFGYDEFERLTTNKYQDIYNVSQNKASVSYKENGNINVKSDAGTYVYAQPPASPYQLSQINNQVNNISLNTLNITYNDFRKVKKITESVTNKDIDFTYGNDEERIKMEYKVAGSTIYKRFYTNDYDLQETNSGNKEWNYVYSPTGLCAVYYNDNGTAQLNYVFTDHLGSPLALVNNQQVIEQYSFDAWGRRRDPANWNSYTNITAPTHMIRGYTMHEHLDEVGIINMNGRIYDPVLGRFLQTDNHVQNPDNLQNYNRYSYCYNNPLKYTDPSGEIVGLVAWPMGFVCNVLGNIAEGGHANVFADAVTQTNWFFGVMNNAVSCQVYNNGQTAVSVGLNPFAMGIGVGVSHTSGDVTYSAFAGVGIGGFIANGSVSYQAENGLSLSIGGGASGNTQSFGGTVSYKGFGVGYYRTHYGSSSDNPTGASNSQLVGGVSVFGKNWSFRLENDFLAGSGDRWRTNAWELSVGKYSVGSYIYTNDPAGEGDGFDEKGRSKMYGLNDFFDDNKGAWNHGTVYSSPLWVGSSYGGASSRMGISRPWIQDVQQNGIHKYFGPGHQNFYNQYSQDINNPYFFNGFSNPYSIYGK